MQPDFIATLLAEAQHRGIHTAIETASNVPWVFMAKVLPHIDTVLHDIKLTDPGRHSPEAPRRFQAIIDEAFGRSSSPSPV